VTNRPVDPLRRRTDALEDRVLDADLGSALFDYQAPVETDALVGYAVYLDDTLLYRKAIARTAIDITGTEVGADRSAYVAGSVYKKYGGTVADIACAGKITIAAADLAAACVDGVVHTGALYASGTPGKPGRLTPQQPPLGVLVCIAAGPDAAGNYALMLCPTSRDFLTSHVHYKASLAMVHSTDVGTAGWVTIGSTPGNTLFANMTVPAGAAYGYNIVADTVLSKVWPPIPATAAYLERNGTGVRMDGTTSHETAIVNADGIWWMSGGVNDQPYGKADINPGSGCITYPDRIDVWFSRLKFRTSDSLVTSLVAADGTMEVVRTDGSPGSTGNLKARCKVALTDSDGTTGFEVVKTFNGLIAQRGVALEGIKAGSGRLTLSGGTPVDEVPEADPSGYLGGRIIVDVPASAAGIEGDFDTVDLDGVDVGVDSGVQKFTFRSGIAGRIRGRMRIPVTAIGTVNVALELLVQAGANGTLPDLPLSYRHIVSPANETAFTTTLPSSDTALSNVPLSGFGAVLAGNCGKKTTDHAAGAAEDEILFSLSRSASDGYAGDVSIVSIKWKIV
jgi:hypothetical protein